jgi:ubiquinone/menaquinone biosynthesis C-methylase UbiE
MALKRDFTRYLNFIFDNLVPPYLRDNKYFMWPFFYSLFGSKTKHFMEFKKIAHHLNGEQFRNYYVLLADKHLQRKTDLNSKTIEYIFNGISGNTVLDIACGRGYIVGMLAERFPGKKIYGIDIVSPQMEEKPDNLVIGSGNVENIDYPDGFFDTVICAHTLEHVQDIGKAIGELRRVCREKLIIVVPMQREYKYTFDLHLHFFPYPESLIRALKNPEAECRVVDGDIVYTEIAGKAR